MTKRSISLLGLVLASALAIMAAAGGWIWSTRTPHGVAASESDGQVAKGAAVAKLSDSGVARSLTSAPKALNVPDAVPAVSDPARPRSFELPRFPQGIGPALRVAVDSGDGRSALTLATVMDECSSAERVMEVFRSRMSEVRDPAVQRGMLEEHANLQRLANECAAAGVDYGSKKRELLDLAVGQKEFGAAAALFLAGGRSPETVLLLKRDAIAGSMQSLAILASDRIGRIEMPLSERLTYRAALDLAMKDPELRSTALAYLEMSQGTWFAANIEPPTLNGKTGDIKDWRSGGPYPPEAEREARKILEMLVYRRRNGQAS